MRIDADVAVVGSGFAGSLFSLALLRRGFSVALLERGRHPRFAIGESSTPLANLLLEEIADRYGLPQVRSLSKWGTWRRAHPDLACGLKRGFSFYRHDAGAAFHDDASHARQLLVAASPHDEVADTHWYRPDFDAYLAALAAEAGARYCDETRLEGVDFDGGGASLSGTRHGERVEVRAGFLVDASGPRGFLSRALKLPDAPTRFLPGTQALYTHFENVTRWDALVPGDPPPYPVDDAALHHVFPGGWIWVLRFSNGITSAGAAVEDAVAEELRLAEGEPAWRRLLARLPPVGAQFAEARAVLPFVHAPRVAFRTAPAAGQAWALLPSAAGVVDPLLSTGFPLTLLGIERLAAILEETRPGEDRASRLAEYARATQEELDATEALVAALYATMADFALFKRVGLLYFAAASFAETVRRLGRPERAPGFLLCRDPFFGPELRACSLAACARPEGTARQALLDRIDRVIAPYDVAGLFDTSRRDFYPVLASDLRRAAPRLGASPAEVDALLARCGLL